MKRFISLLVLIAFCSGCASTYKGPDPDFSKTGDSAKAEYENFKLASPFWEANHTVLMGRNEKRYTLHSLSPVINEVSPRATDDLRIARNWRLSGLVFLAAFIVCLVQPIDTYAFGTGTWMALGGMVGVDVISGVYRNDAVDEYNTDLHKKLMPHVSASISF